MPTVARGGPPLITDDPETPGRGGWEINLSYGLEITRERVRREPGRGTEFATDVLNGVAERLGLGRFIGEVEAPPRRTRRYGLEHELPLVDINYGVGERDQIKIEFPVLIQDPPDGSTEGGFGHVQVGYKYRFLDESSYPVSMSLYPQMDIPTGADRLNLNRKPAYILPVQVGRHWLDDRLFVYGEVGFAAAPGKDADDEWFYGIAAESEIREGFKVLGEVHGVVPTHGPSESDVLFNLGFKWTIHENVTLMAAMGRSLRSSGPDHPEFVGFWGVQLTF